MSNPATVPLDHSFASILCRSFGWMFIFSPTDSPQLVSIRPQVLLSWLYPCVWVWSGNHPTQVMWLWQIHMLLKKTRNRWNRWAQPWIFCHKMEILRSFCLKEIQELAAPGETHGQACQGPGASCPQPGTGEAARYVFRVKNWCPLMDKETNGFNDDLCYLMLWLHILTPIGSIGYWVLILNQQAVLKGY